MSPSVAEYRTVAAAMFAGAAAIALIVPLGLALVQMVLLAAGEEADVALIVGGGGLVTLGAATAATVASRLAPWMVDQATRQEPSTGGKGAGFAITAISWLLVPVAFCMLSLLYYTLEGWVSGVSAFTGSTSLQGVTDGIAYLAFCGLPFFLFGLLPGCAAGQAFYRYVREKEAVGASDTALAQEEG